MDRCHEEAVHSFLVALMKKRYPYLGPDFDGISYWTKSLAEYETVISLGRGSETREFSRLGPVELARINDNACDCCAVPSNPLGCTVNCN